MKQIIIFTLLFSSICYSQTGSISEKASFKVKTVQFKNNEFYSDLSEKLFWGLDKRN